MTRIAISIANDEGLDGAISPHFGQCPFFALVDLKDTEIEAVQVIANPYSGNHQPGQVPGFVHSQGAQVMLAAGMGRRALDFFSQYGVEVATGASGTVRQAMQQYLAGQLAGAAPCRESEEHGHGRSAEQGGHA